MAFDNPRSILITGASSGIGEDLSLAYAAPGRYLALHGRNADRLNAVAEKCRAKGADVTTALCDVTAREELSNWITETDQNHPLDLVIANAGISRHPKTVAELDDTTNQVFDTNINGVVNTVHPALIPMVKRGRGQIAIVSSIAGLIAMPHAPAYCASKFAVRIYGEALRMRYGKDGVGISVICPGFVKSPLTDENKFPMPFLMEGDKAARIIIKGLARNRGRIAFPLLMLALVRLVGCMPYPLVHWVMKQK